MSRFGAHLGGITETGGKDAAITGTLGSMPLRSGGHPWLPVNAASSRVVQNWWCFQDAPSVSPGFTKGWHRLCNV
jgi:hypothetical protein